MTNNSLLTEPLMHFAEAVRVKMAAFAEGEPEDQLRTPFENFMSSVGGTLGWDLVCKGETPLPDRLGKPDFAVAGVSPEDRRTTARPRLKSSCERAAE